MKRSVRSLVAGIMLVMMTAGCTALGKGSEMNREEALAQTSAIVEQLIMQVGGDWKQHALPSTGPCSTGGSQRGFEWADDWDGEGIRDVDKALDVAEQLLRQIGLETERQPGPYGAAVHGMALDGRSVLLDIGDNGRALLDARSACFPAAPEDH